MSKRVLRELRLGAAAGEMPRGFASWGGCMAEAACMHDGHNIEAVSILRNNNNKNNDIDNNNSNKMILILLILKITVINNNIDNSSNK